MVKLRAVASDIKSWWQQARHTIIMLQQACEQLPSHAEHSFILQSQHMHSVSCQHNTVNHDKHMQLEQHACSSVL